MKKTILVLLLVVLLTGCSKKETMTCTYTGVKENNKFSNTVKVTIKDDKVIESTLDSEYEKEDAATNICNMYKLAKDDAEVSCEGKKITIKGFHKTINDNKEVTKSEMFDYLDHQGYTCK